MAYQYAGFLSYAHADEKIAARLHKALETYKVPKDQTGALSPIFRDVAELTAHHSLPEKIQQAVTGSRFLLVLCSPAAKNSLWVNEEIRLFRKLHGDASILCVLAEGSPEISFPPALLEGGREPLAASLGETKEGFRLGVTQIAAAMLGVGLDRLIQRDAKRKRRRLQGVTATALLFSTFMGTTTYSAVKAREAADESRTQAEGLVEYMITDLKEKLEPVGRLDILDGIGTRAVEYYDAQNIDMLPDDSLARQARARHILGQVALDAGDYKKARTELEAAARLTLEVYDRNPDDSDAIYAHAQSEYWVGAVYFYEEDYGGVLPHWKEYEASAERLYEIDPENLDWNMERAYGANNMGLVLYRLKNMEKATELYIKATEYFESALELSPDNTSIQFELANVWAGLANIAYDGEDTPLELTYRREQIQVYESMLGVETNNYKLNFRLVLAKESIIRSNLVELDEKEILETVEYCFQEYDRLLAHDPANKTWQKSYGRLVGFLSEAQAKHHIEGLDTLQIEARLKNFQEN